jgi:hypothetical protein
MAEPPAQVTPTGIEARPRLVGYNPLDLIIAASAILISCVSLYIAMQQTSTMEKTLAASSWPLLQMHTGNASNGEPNISFVIQNVGVGPAIVKDFYAEYNGKRTSIPAKIIGLCCGSFPTNKRKFEAGDPLSNFVANTVIRAGEDLDVLNLPRAPKNEAVWLKLNDERFRMKYYACYCSILGNCWESDLSGTDTKPVQQCPPAMKEPK